jgi:hypothetical protein
MADLRCYSRFLYIGTRERHLESVLQSSLSELILVQDFPRSLIQIVLQVEAAPENVYVNTKLVQGGVVSHYQFCSFLPSSLPVSHFAGLVVLLVW